MLVNAIIEIVALIVIILVGSLIISKGTEVISTEGVCSRMGGAALILLAWLIIIGGIFYTLVIRHIN